MEKLCPGLLDEDVIIKFFFSLLKSDHALRQVLLGLRALTLTFGVKAALRAGLYGDRHHRSANIECANATLCRGKGLALCHAVLGKV